MAWVFAGFEAGRLSRQVAFVAGPMAQRVPLIVADPGRGCGPVHAAPVRSDCREAATATLLLHAKPASFMLPLKRAPQPTASGRTGSVRARASRKLQSAACERRSPTDSEDLEVAQDMC